MIQYKLRLKLGQANMHGHLHTSCPSELHMQMHHQQLPLDVSGIGEISNTTLVIELAAQCAAPSGMSP